MGKNIGREWTECWKVSNLEFYEFAKTMVNGWDEQSDIKKKKKTNKEA